MCLHKTVFVDLCDLLQYSIELNRSIFDQQLEINILNHSIDSTNKEIVKVRKYYAKKIKDITTYTPTQLDNFFTERYQ